MYGPDPFTTVASAQMLRTHAEGPKRARRHRPQRPRQEDGTELIAVSSRAMPTALLGALVAMLGRPVVTLRGYIRPRAAL